MAGDILEVAHVSRALGAINYHTDTLRSYAAVFEAVRRDFPDGPLRKPSEISVLAANCIRLVADLKDMDVSPRHDSSARIEGLHNPLGTDDGEHVEEFVEGKYLHR